jgi:hypothetical protein
MSVPLTSGIVNCTCNKKMVNLTGKLCDYVDLKDFLQEQKWLETRSTTDLLPTMTSKYQYLLEAKITLSLSGTPYVPLKSKIENIGCSSLKGMGKKSLEMGLFTDFTLKCQNKSYPCHKVVLAGHSDAMAAMLSCDMIEERSQEMTIRDMTPAGVEALLKFFYYGDLQGPKESSLLAIELLKAGEKYLVPQLKEACIEILCDFDVTKIDAVPAFQMFELGGIMSEFECLQHIAVQAFTKYDDRDKASWGYYDHMCI